MAEPNSDVKQRVEALEQLSHHRVIERVGEVEQRMSRVEGTRVSDERHVATKADVAGLRSLVIETSSAQQAEIAEARQETRDLHVKAMLEITEARQETRDLHAKAMLEIAEARQEARDLNAKTSQEARDLNAKTSQEARDLNAETRQEARDLNAETRRESTAQFETARREATAQTAELRQYMDDKFDEWSREHKQQTRQLIMWLIGTAIALAAVLIAATGLIVTRLPA